MIVSRLRVRASTDYITHTPDASVSDCDMEWCKTTVHLHGWICAMQDCFKGIVVESAGAVGIENLHVRVVREESDGDVFGGCVV